MRKVAVIAALGLILAGLSACSQKTPLAVMDSTVTVETAAAARGSLSSDCAYIGTISAEGTAYVVSMVSANVEAVNVEVGDRVSAGQPLCDLDDTAARLNLETAKAAISSAEAGILSAAAGTQQASAAVASAQQNYQAQAAQYGGDGNSLPVLEEQVRMAEENYENTKALLAIGAASQIEVDQAYQAMLNARAGLQAAKAGLSAAQAGVDQAKAGLSSSSAGSASAQAGLEQANAAVAAAEYQLSLYHLASPVDGVVETVNVSENNFAASGSPAFVISKDAERSVTFYVTDQVRKTLQMGQRVSVAAGDQTCEGEINEIAGVVDPQAGLFKIKAALSGAAGLPDGLSVELTTAAYAADDAIIIPSDALYFEDGEAYVYLAKDGAAVKTPVSVGLYTAEEIAVTGGLSEGDPVITSWSANLRDGAAVRLADDVPDGGSEG